MKAESLRPPRSEHCPSAHQLDGFCAGEPTASHTTRHIEACAICMNYVASVRTQQQAFLAQHSFQLFQNKLKHREKPRSWWKVLSMVLVPVAVLAVVAIIQVPHLDSEEGVRLKGGNFRVMVKHASGAVEQVQPEHPMVEGDTLRFFFDAPTAGEVAVLSLDGQGKATVYVPFGQLESVPIEAHQREPLKGSVELDGIQGAEWLVLVFSPNRFSTGSLLRQLEQTPSLPPVVSCPKCQISTLRIEKGPR